MYSIHDNIFADILDVAKYKKLSVLTANALLSSKDPDLVRRGQEVGSCGTFLGYFEDNETGKYQLTASNFCRQRLCPACARRRSLRVYAQLSAIAELLSSDYSFLHLVLTVPNVSDEELSDKISFLFSSSSKMFRTEPFKKAWRGVLRCLEVSYNPKRQDWHPHLHCLVAVRKSYFTGRQYIKHGTIQASWGVLVGVDHVNIHIQKCRGSGAIAEVAKYSVKPLQLDCFTVAEHERLLGVLHKALHSRRLIQTYGVFRTAASSLHIDLNSDIVDTGDYNRRFVYNYSTGEYDET